MRPSPYQDIEASRDRALAMQGWLFGERFNRIGNPFTWVDGEQMPGLHAAQGTLSVLQYLAMSGEIYETPSAIRPLDHDHVRQDLEARLRQAYRHFIPFLDESASGFSKYIVSTASVKVQDYGAIRTFCPDLPAAPRQLDIGPGLGGNALYSAFHLGGTYMACDAHPVSYAVQRQFLRMLAAGRPEYLDTVDCETFGLSPAAITTQIADPAYRFVQVPSWHLPLVADASVDLASATWVLNEVTPAGIVWLIHHICRTVRTGGYVYIRDSGLRKPLRHDVDYDSLLPQLGFELVGRLDVLNRVDMHGIPRVYRCRSSVETDFDSLFQDVFGRFGVTAHGGAMNQSAPR